MSEPKKHSDNFQSLGRSLFLRINNNNNKKHYYARFEHKSKKFKNTNGNPVFYVPYQSLHDLPECPLPAIESGQNETIRKELAYSRLLWAKAETKKEDMGLDPFDLFPYSLRKKKDEELKEQEKQQRIKNILLKDFVEEHWEHKIDRVENKSNYNIHSSYEKHLKKRLESPVYIKEVGEKELTRFEPYQLTIFNFYKYPQLLETLLTYAVIDNTTEEEELHSDFKKYFAQKKKYDIQIKALNAKKPNTIINNIKKTLYPVFSKVAHQNDFDFTHTNLLENPSINAITRKFHNLGSKAKIFQRFKAIGQEDYIYIASEFLKGCVNFKRQRKLKNPDDLEIRLALVLLSVTVRRVEEVPKYRYEWVDDDMTITIPEGVSKNKNAERFPIPEIVYNKLKDRKKGLIFPNLIVQTLRDNQTRVIEGLDLANIKDGHKLFGHDKRNLFITIMSFHYDRTLIQYLISHSKTSDSTYDDKAITVKVFHKFWELIGLNNVNSF